MMLKKNLFYNSLLSVSQFIFPLITFPYTSRILKPEGIGTVNFIDSFTQYFILFSALGIPIYGIREVAKRKNNPAELGKLFNEIFALHVLSTLIFAAIYFATALMVPSVRVHLDLVLIGIALMLFSTFSVEWFFQGIEEFSYITKRTLIIRIGAVVCLFVFLKPGAPPSVYYALTAGIVLVNGISNLYHLKKYVAIKIRPIVVKAHVKPLLMIFGSTLAVTAYVLLDNVILGLMQGVVAVGFYATAVRIVRIPYAFINAINGVMVPQISRAHHEGEFNKIQDYINKSFVFICVIGVPVTVGIMVSAQFIVHSFAGEQFGNSIRVLQIIAPIIMLVGFNSVLGTQLLTPIGKEKYLLITVVCGMVFSIILNLCLIPVLSYTGSAITTVLTEVLVTALSFYFAKKFTDISFHKNILFECLAGAALFIPIALLIRRLEINYYVKELIIIGSCAIAYIAFIWFFVKNVHVNGIKQLIIGKIKLKTN